MKKVKLFEEFITENNTFTGDEVAQYIEDITPEESDVPDYFIDKFIKPNDGWKLKQIKLKDLLKDKDFKDYYNSGEERYDEYEVDPNDLYNDLVVYKGQLLDGYSRAAKMLRDGEKTAGAYVLDESVSERFITIRDVIQWEKDNGKLPIPKRIAQISKDMVKSGFINKDDKLTQAKLWIALEDVSWIEMKKKFGPIVGKFYGGEFYNEMTDVISIKASYYAYEVSKQVADKVANDEEVEPAYYELKTYFNAFGMDYNRSRIFNSAVDKLENWMKSNKIETL
jgi:hypothetical protein